MTPVGCFYIDKFMLDLFRIHREAKNRCGVLGVLASNLHDHLKADVLQGIPKRRISLRPVLVAHPEKQVVLAGL
jgi:hypothetical protein